MERFSKRENHGIIFILHSTLLLTLYIKGSECEPFWIWTKGCMGKATESTNTLNLTDNTPFTCFKACDKGTLTVALQGNLCSCGATTKIRRRTSECEACDLNKRTACGNGPKGYWSSYMKAGDQELSGHGINKNASGCVVSNRSNKSFYVENCNRSGLRSICSNAFTWKTTCDNSQSKWSTDSCNTGNGQDRLVDNFADIDKLDRICRGIFWTGLFSFETSISPPETTNPSSKEMIAYSTAALYSIVSEISSFTVLEDSSTPEYAVTKHSSLDSNSMSIQITPSSLYVANESIYQTSTNVLITETSDGPSRSQTSTKEPTETNQPGSILHMSFTDKTTVYKEPLFPTPTLKYAPVLSSCLSDSLIFNSIAKNTVSQTSTIAIKNFNSITLPTKQTAAELTAIPSAATKSTNVLITETSDGPSRSQTSTNVLTETNDGSSRSQTSTKEPTETNQPGSILHMSFTDKTTVYKEPLFPTPTLKYAPVLSSSLSYSLFFNSIEKNTVSQTSTIAIKNFNSITLPTKQTAAELTAIPSAATKSTVLSSSETVDTRSGTLPSTGSKDKDRMTALTVVSVIAALALVIVVISAVNIQRLRKKVKLGLGRMTTLTDDYIANETETSLDDGNDSELRNGNNSDVLNTSCNFSAAKRANLGIQGNLPSSLYNGRPVQENEKVFY